MIEASSYRGPGFSRGLFVDSSGVKSVGASGVIAFAVTWLLMHRGFSGYDDGAYAWAIEGLSAGDRLHVEIPWGHPGYVLWMLMPFRDFLSTDILHFRYFLPPLAALTAASCAAAGNLRSIPAGLATGFAVAALGFAQFSTYSASWFGIALTAASLACAHRAKGQYPAWLLASGLLAGVAFGFRGPNGIMAAAGSLVVVAFALGVNRGTARPLSSWVLASLLLILGLAIAMLASSAERILFALPIVTCLLVTARHVLVSNPRIYRAFVLLSTGFAAGLLPLFAVTIHQDSMFAMLHDIVLIPAQISDAGNRFRSNGVLDMASLTLDLLRAPPSLARATNVGLFLVTALSPVWLAVRWMRDELPSTPLVLATVACLALLLLPNIIYAPHVWPFIALVVLADAPDDWRRQCATTALCLVAIFISPRGMIPGSHNWFADPDRITPTPCPLPRCSVVADERTMAYLDESVAAIRRAVPPGQPLIVLPTTSSFTYFLPNQAPFTLTWPDMRGDPQATAAFRREFVDGKYLTIALEAADMESYALVVDGLCLYRKDGLWRFYRTCPEKGQPVALQAREVR